MLEDPVAQYYKRHHAGETGFRRYGFTIGGTDRANWFRQRIGQGKDVLDIGCRDGTMTRQFMPGNRVTGVDIDDHALEQARRALGIQTVNVNLNHQKLAFADESFDVVIAGEVLEHVQFPDVVVAELRRVLKTGGKFIGSVPNAFRLRNRLMFLAGQDFESDPTHLHQFSPASLRRLLSAFRDLEVDFLCSRHLWLSRRLMGTDMVWSCSK